MKKVLLIVSACAMGLAMLAFCCGCFAARATLSDTQTYDLDDITSIELSYGADNLMIYTGSGNELIVKEFLSTDNTSYHAVMTADGTILHVDSGTRPDDAYFSSYVEIYIPQSYTGSISIETDNGLIQMNSGTRLASCSLSSSSGSISVRDVTAEHISVTTSSGSITATDLAGDTELTTTTGSITTSSLRGYGDFSTTSGNILLDFEALSGHITAISESGKITLALPKLCSYHLTASTVDGYITSKISSNDATTTLSDTSADIVYGSGGFSDTVKITTESGAIAINYH